MSMGHNPQCPRRCRRRTWFDGTRLECTSNPGSPCNPRYRLGRYLESSCRGHIARQALPKCRRHTRARRALPQMGIGSQAGFDRSMSSPGKCFFPDRTPRRPRQCHRHTRESCKRRQGRACMCTTNPASYNLPNNRGCLGIDPRRTSLRGPLARFHLRKTAVWCKTRAYIASQLPFDKWRNSRCPDSADRRFHPVQCGRSHTRRGQRISAREHIYDRDLGSYSPRNSRDFLGIGPDRKPLPD